MLNIFAIAVTVAPNVLMFAPVVLSSVQIAPVTCVRIADTVRIVSVTVAGAIAVMYAVTV